MDIFYYFKVGGTLRVAILFVIGISSLIRHSDFLIRHCFVGWGLTPRGFLSNLKYVKENNYGM